MQGYREELRDSEREKLKLKSSVTRLKGDIENRRLGSSLPSFLSPPTSSLPSFSLPPFSPPPSTYSFNSPTSLSPSNLIESQRDRLMKKLVEVEMDSSSVARQAEALNLSIKRLQKVHYRDQPLFLATNHFFFLFNWLLDIACL